MRDVISNTQTAFLGTLTLAGTTAATSQYVDVRGFNGAALMLVAKTVTDAGTADGFTATLQESEDTTGAGAGAVADDETTLQSNGIQVTDDAASGVVGVLGYNGTKRYLGFTVVGTTGTDAEVDVYAILGKPSVAPTTFEGAGIART